MNYITIINNFWTKQLTAPVSSGATALFFYLLQQANIRHWNFPITLTNSLIIAELRISKSSFLRYRNELQDNGYLSYYQLSNLVGYNYTITLKDNKRSSSKFDAVSDTLSDTRDAVSDTVSDALSDTVCDTVCNAPYDTGGGLSSYNNINKEKEKDLNKDFKQKRFYNNKNYNDKEIYNSGRYDFERIERVARRKILEEVRKYDEEDALASSKNV